MTNSLFQQIKQLIDDGAAPGCAVGFHAVGHTETFAYGTYCGSGSQIATPQTLYDVASVTKLFTTALVLQAHEQGMLSIYDRCGLYLDNFRNSELTIIDLLTHRMALQFGLGALRAGNPTQDKLREAIMRIVPPKSPTKYVDYHNWGPLFAGYILEKVHSQSLQKQMTELIDTLNLGSTCTGVDVLRQHIVTPPTEVVRGQIVAGMTHDESARMLGGLAGHAGVFSNTEDLIIFGRAWLDRKIVTTDALCQEAFRDHDASGDNPQAIGWWLRYKNAAGEIVKTPGTFSHAGFTGPLLAIRPEGNKACAFVCNRTYYGRNNTKHRQIWKLLFDWMQED